MATYTAEIGPVLLEVEAKTEEEAIQLMLENVKATRKEVISCIRKINEVVRTA